MLAPVKNLILKILSETLFKGPVAFRKRSITKNRSAEALQKSYSAFTPFYFRKEPNIYELRSYHLKPGILKAEFLYISKFFIYGIVSRDISCNHVMHLAFNIKKKQEPASAIVASTGKRENLQNMCTFSHIIARNLFLNTGMPKKA
jgi:hypothetical protein